MLDANLTALFQCPATGRPLTLDRDAAAVEEVNAGLAAGRLTLASGETPEQPVEGLLRVGGDGPVYPVIDDVAYLLAENAVVSARESSSGSPPSGRRSQAERDIQRRQMESYSRVYERWTGGEKGITRALQRGLHERYRNLFAGAVVLDVGNGGTPPEKQLGPELAGTVERFIAADKSLDMLLRSGPFGDLLLADAFALPFATDAVDVVMVNNTIHHFGLRRGEDPAAKIRGFLAEALRVARRGVVGVELLVPPVAQSLERLLLKPAGFLPTFVYSASFYDKTFGEAGLRVTDFGVRKLRQLTSPWRMIPPVLDFTWLRVPTFLVPYSFLFFSIDKQGLHR